MTVDVLVGDDIIVNRRKDTAKRGGVAFPDWQVWLDGENITPKIEPFLMRLSVSERRGDLADQLDIELDDSKGLLDIPKSGAELAVSLGWKGGARTTPGLVDKGTFIVDEAEHRGPPNVIMVRGRSADFTAEWRKLRDGSWRNNTLGAVITDIAARQSLQPNVSDVLASTPIVLITQSRESDMALITRLGKDYDAVSTVKNGTLIFTAMAGGKSASGSALETITIKRSDGDGHSYRIEAREDWTGVIAKWHDKKAAKQKHVRVGRHRSAKTAVKRVARAHASAAHKKLSSAAKAALKAARTREAEARHAAQVAARAAAHERAEAEATARHKAREAETARTKAHRAVELAGKVAGNRDNPKVLKKIFASEAEAQRAATAEWTRIQRAPRKLSLNLALGRPEIGAEQPAIAIGFHPEIDEQDWIVSEANHTLDSKGLTSGLQLEVPENALEGGAPDESEAV